MKLKRRDLAAWPLGWGLPAGAAWADAADPHAWLEDVESVRALEWVNARNAEAMALVQAEPQFERRHRETLETLNSLASSTPKSRGFRAWEPARTAHNVAGILERGVLTASN